MEKLIQLLLNMIQRAQFLTEEAREDELDLLREVEAAYDVSGVVPPKAGPINAPVEPVAETPPVPDPVAEPVPADQQPVPPTSPDLAGAAPEETNAFADPGAST
jgi:hypothetical protein